jgi:DNA-binding MarR family transcriptional regulator
MLVRMSRDNDHSRFIFCKIFLENSNISLSAKGLLFYCIFQPEDWKFNMLEMTNILNISRYTLNSILKELIDNKYINQSHVEYDCE